MKKKKTKTIYQAEKDKLNSIYEHTTKNIKFPGQPLDLEF